MRPEHIYKIFQTPEWASFRESGIYQGSPVDMDDGFIHLSCAHQLQGTLDKHYTNGKNLVVGQISAARLGKALIYEVSRGGEDFPHLYGKLPMDAVSEHWPLTPNKEGRYAAGALPIS